MSGSSLFGRLTAALAGLAGGLGGLSGAAVAATQPQSVAPSAAPAEWLRYAEAATTTITAWLQEDSEAAIRLRTHLDASRPAADQPTSALLLKIWIDPDGRVARIDFAPFVEAQPGADLRSLIVGRALGAPPPKGMVLPLRLAVQLAPAEPVPVPADTVGRFSARPVLAALAPGGQR